jgi:hypothetical protein
MDRFCQPHSPYTVLAVRPPRGRIRPNSRLAMLLFLFSFLTSASLEATAGDQPSGDPNRVVAEPCSSAFTKCIARVASCELKRARDRRLHAGDRPAGYWQSHGSTGVNVLGIADR